MTKEAQSSNEQLGRCVGHLKKSAGRSQDLLDVEKLRKLNLHRKKP
jgi:hypothetical protein